MSDAADRLARFEAWAKAKRPALRAQDRRKVALELFEMVGDEVVLKLDVDSLMKRYRDGLLGAQAVLLVRKVGDDILAWQEAELSLRRAGRREAHDERDDEDEAVDRERDEADLDHDQGDDEGDRDRDGPREGDEPPAERHTSSAPPSARAWARKSESPEPAARPRSSAGAKSGATKRDDDAADDELGADARAVLDRWTFDEEDSHSSRRVDRANEWDETSDISTLWRDKSGVGSVRGRLRREEDEEPSASDDAPRSSAPRTSAPPSPASEEDEAPAKDSAPRPERSPERAPTKSAEPAPLKATTIASVGGVVLVILLVVLAARRGWFSAPKDEAVTGDYASSHLRLSLRFKDVWTHAKSLDVSEVEKDGWSRREAFFYQGAAPTEFDRTLLVVSYEKSAPAVEADLRDLGPRRLAPDAVLRSCVPLADGRTGTRCESVSGGTFPTVEAYFVSGPRVVFVRGVVSPAVVEKERAAGDTHPFAAIDEVISGITASR